MIKENQYFIVEKQSNETDDEPWIAVDIFANLNTAINCKNKLESINPELSYRIALVARIFMVIYP